MAFCSFEDLDVWKRASRLAVRIYQELDNCRDYGLKDQMTRAAVSIARTLKTENYIDASAKNGKMRCCGDKSLIVISHDVNTMPAEAYARLAAGKTIPGLLMVQQTEPVGAIIESLLLIWSASEAEEWKNQVYFLPFA